MDWTDGEDRWRAMHYGETESDPRPDDEERLSEREEPEAVAEEPRMEQAVPDVPKAPARRRDRVPTFEFTGAQWDAFLTRACTPQHETQTEPPAERVA